MRLSQLASESEWWAVLGCRQWDSLVTRQETILGALALCSETWVSTCAFFCQSWGQTLYCNRQFMSLSPLRSTCSLCPLQTHGEHCSKCGDRERTRHGPCPSRSSQSDGGDRHTDNHRHRWAGFGPEPASRSQGSSRVIQCGVDFRKKRQAVQAPGKLGWEARSLRREGNTKCMRWKSWTFA